MRPLLPILIATLLAALPALRAQPQTGKTEGGSLIEIPLAKLSERVGSRLGTAALGIRAAEWRHAETENFIYHYFNGFIAGPVSVEAEFYYRVIAKDLGKDTSEWERKCQIYIFEQDTDWEAFKKVGKLDPWTGGLHSGNELFIQRDPARKWKGDTLGHETAHLVIDRFYGATNLPLWLNEGYASYIGGVGYAAFYRARGFSAKPRSWPLAPTEVLPLTTLTGYVSYPPEPGVKVFYRQSEKLVRYLTSLGDAKFNTFLGEMAKGKRLENALSAAYGSGLTLSSLERDFKVYATKDYTPQSLRERDEAWKQEAAESGRD